MPDSSTVSNLGRVMSIENKRGGKGKCSLDPKNSALRKNILRRVSRIANHSTVSKAF